MVKSTGFHRFHRFHEIRRISWMWAFGWWSSIGLSIERPIITRISSDVSVVSAGSFHSSSWNFRVYLTYNFIAVNVTALPCILLLYEWRFPLHSLKTKSQRGDRVSLLHLCHPISGDTVSLLLYFKRTSEEYVISKDEKKLTLGPVLQNTESWYNRTNFLLLSLQDRKKCLSILSTNRAQSSPLFLTYGIKKYWLAKKKVMFGKWV